MVSAEGGAFSGAVDAREPPGGASDDPALAFIASIWPALPQNVRQRVLDVIREAAGVARA